MKALPGISARRRRRRRQAGRQGRGRLPRAHRAVAGDAAHDLGRRRAVQGHLLVALREHVLRRRRRQARRGRRHLAARPGRRRDERVRATGCRPPRSSRRWSRTRRSPRRRSSAPRTRTPARRSCAFVILRESRRRRRRGHRRGAARPRRQGDRQDRPAAPDHGRPRAAEDPLGQDHAAAAARRRRGPRGRRRHHAGRLHGDGPDLRQPQGRQRPTRTEPLSADDGAVLLGEHARRRPGPAGCRASGRRRRSACCSVAPRRSASHRSAPRSTRRDRSQPVRTAPVRSASARSASVSTSPGQVHPGRARAAHRDAAPLAAGRPSAGAACSRTKTEPASCCRAGWRRTTTYDAACSRRRPPTSRTAALKRTSRTCRTRRPRRGPSPR